MNEIRGVNSRLDPVQAAVLRVKLKHLEEWTTRRSSIAALYNRELGQSGLVLPSVPEWADPAWHLYVVRCSDRTSLQARLNEAGIGTLIHYPIPPHMQQAYADLELAAEALPIAGQLADEVLSLPMGPQLTLAGAEQVIAAIRAVA